MHVCAAVRVFPGPDSSERSEQTGPKPAELGGAILRLKAATCLTALVQVSELV